MLRYVPVDGDETLLSKQVGWNSNPSDLY